MPSQREIVLIPVPYSDLSVIKNRPVLILSSDSLLQRSPDMLVASITSNITAPLQPEWLESFLIRLIWSEEQFRVKV